MKARHRALIAAEGAAIDQLSARVTAFNMLDAIAVSSIPTLFLRLVAISMYELGSAAEVVTERISFVDPDGKVVSSVEHALNLPGREAGDVVTAHRSISNLWRIRLDQAGDYRLRAEHLKDGAWVEVSSLCISVSVLPMHGFQSPQPTPLAPAPETQD